MTCIRSRIAIVSPELNGFIYFYLIVIILFNMNHLFIYCEVLTSIAIEHY